MSEKKEQRTRASERLTAKKGKKKKKRQRRRPRCSVSKRRSPSFSSSVSSNAMSSIALDWKRERSGFEREGFCALFASRCVGGTTTLTLGVAAAVENLRLPPASKINFCSNSPRVCLRWRAWHRGQQIEPGGIRALIGRLGRSFGDGGRWSDERKRQVVRSSSGKFVASDCLSCWRRETSRRGDFTHARLRGGT